MRISSFSELPKDEDPIIAREATLRGWRGLTEKGEILNVTSRNGDVAKIPEGDVIMMRGKEATSMRSVKNSGASIDEYFEHFNRATTHVTMGQAAEALGEIDKAIAIAPTLYARYNRSMMLLHLGRWPEGFEEYWNCELSTPFRREWVRICLESGMSPWRGEPLRGKKILLVHAHGYGDTLMTLRYVPILKSLGAEVILWMPPALLTIAEDFAAITTDLVDADFFCPMLHLLGSLSVTPGDAGSCAPYIKVDKQPIENGDKERVGIVWSVGTESTGDYPRSIPLEKLVAALPDAEIHSLQTQGAAHAQRLGVKTHEFSDFRDCAMLMMTMDRVVSVDTAALHLAGAIGHPRVVGLLSKWSSWRWNARWYDRVNLCRQRSSGNWDSALDQMEIF